MTSPLPLGRLSYAVAARRFELPDSADDFPTQPWAVRALVEHIIGPGRDLARSTALEPACGREYMADTLSEYFGEVRASDAYPYGSNEVQDFLSGSYETSSYDWVITNPPFKLGERFILEALRVARVGVAMLVRTSFVEGVGRYNRLYIDTPFTTNAQYVERVPIVKGRIDIEATTATSYTWVIWEKDRPLASGEFPRFRWIPPCRKSLELASDYPPDLFVIMRYLLRWS